MTAAEQAQGYFISGYNCAQSVALAFAEKFNVDKEIIAKSASGLGGGIQMGEVCGALSGAVLIIGLACGQSEAGDVDAKKACYANTKAFAEAFQRENGCLTCRELVERNVSGNSQEESTANKKAYCRGLVARAAQLLVKMGY